MFTAALVLSIATNVGLLFYIFANDLLDGWEKKNGTRNSTGISMHKRAPMVRRIQNEQE